MIKFLQRIGKSLVLPISCVPLAGLMIRFGQSDVINFLSFLPFISDVLPYLAYAGNVLLQNLPLLFAVGVAIGLSDDQHGSSGLSGAISYLILSSVANQYYSINFNQSLSTSFLYGVISGIIGSFSYNKFRQINPPEILAFFSGRRLAPIMSGLISFIIAIPFAISWGFIQNALDNCFVLISQSGAIGVALFGFLNRLLIPIGLHHVLNSFFWFQLGDFNGITGDLSRFLAGDPTAGHFMSGFFPITMFGLPAVALAIYCSAKKENRASVAKILLPLSLTAFLTGITEPLEFIFIFLSPVLLVAHSLLTALSGFITDSLGVLHGFTFSSGLLDYLLNFNISTNSILILPIGLLIFILYFAIFYSLIVALNIPTPGRKNSQEAELSCDVKKLTDSEQAEAFLDYLGGKDNLVKIDNCATRLRLEVVDSDKVKEDELKKVGAKGVLKIDKTTVQVVVGTKVEFLTNNIKDLLK